MDRCMAFLRTDREYVWPVDNFLIVRDADPLSNLLTLGLAGRRRERRYQETMGQLGAVGDVSAWPFVSDDDLRRADGDESANGG